MSCCARSNAARASSRFAIAWRTDAICSSGGGCLSCDAVDAELRLDLAQRALGALERELQLARLEADEHVAGLHLGAELHRHLADDAGDLAADCAWSGESSVPERSTWRWTDMRCTVVAVGGHGLAAASASARSAAAGAAGLAGRSFARDRRERRASR